MGDYGYIFKTRYELEKTEGIEIGIITDKLYLEGHEDVCVTQEMIDNFSGQIIPDNNCTYFGYKIRPWMVKPSNFSLTEAVKYYIKEKQMRSTDELLNPLEYYDRERKVTVRLRSSFHDVREAALNTVGKKYDPDLSKPATPKMKTDYFISEHSPIRSFDIRVTLHDVYYPTSVSFCRHVHSLPYVKTSRADRTGQKRSLDNAVDHMMDCNAQALIDMMRKRLCVGCCSQDVYLWAVAIKRELTGNPETKELGECLVPGCVKFCGCPEFSPCNAFTKIVGDIRERYNEYNGLILTTN